MENNYYVTYLNELENVRIRIDSIRDNYIRTKNWDFERDVRFRFLNQLYRLIMSYDLGIMDFIDKYYNEKKIDDIFGLENGIHTKEILSDYFTFLKNAFLYSYSGIVENYLRTVSRILCAKELKSDHFYEIRSKIFSKLELSKEDKLWKALAILSNIRNCVHNNGIFIGNKNIEIEYNGRKYIFLNNAPQDSSDPHTLISIINDNVTLIQELNEKIDLQSQRFILDPSYQK